MEKKLRGFYMTDEEYADCLRVAGHRKFSAWAKHILLGAARERPLKAGELPGGLCGHSVCKNGGAWMFANFTYYCDSCADYLAEKHPHSAVANFEDRHPSTAGLSQREGLIVEMLRAADALRSYDEKYHKFVAPLADPLADPLKRKEREHGSRTESLFDVMRNGKH